jgi:hypothetical protein
MAFCAIILQLFLENAFDNSKYRRQMVTPIELKVEAYSVLDLALVFLGKYKQNQSVDKIGGGIVKKGSNRFIFDVDILGGKAPNDASISEYIIQKINLNLSSAPLPTGVPKLHAALPNTNTFTHGNLTIQLDFEDLNARIPFCKAFDRVSSGLVIKGLDKLSTGKSPVILQAQAKNKLQAFINQGKQFTKWPTIQFVASASTNLSSTTLEKNPPNVEPLKKWFTIEPYIINFVEKPNKEFKINLLTASKEILDAISDQHGGLVIPATKKFADYSSLIAQGGSLQNNCSNEIQFFELKIRVSTDQSNTYVIRCVCDATTPATHNQRLPFNIIKIEEF